jgi:CheY-like chemotaxis protein
MSEKWRFLIVEDKPDIRNQLKAILPTSVPEGDEAESEECSDFTEGVRRMTQRRFDMLILDLKENDAFAGVDEDPPGLTIFRELKRFRFIPVVFFTGWPQYVRDQATSFVRVVTKGENFTELRDEIRSVFDTNLPKLNRPGFAGAFVM